MNTTTGTSDRYGTVAQFFHWITAVLVVVAFVFGPGGNERHAYAHARDFDRQLHETLGLLVMGLTVLRLLWRRFDRRPELPPLKKSMLIASRVIQGLLYLLLLLVPLTAISGAWFQGHPLTLLAGVEIPSLVAESHDLGTSIARIHTFLGDAILWIAGLHAAAAIYHHRIMKDGILVSMLPRWLFRSS